MIWLKIRACAVSKIVKKVLKCFIEFLLVHTTTSVRVIYCTLCTCDRCIFSKENRSRKKLFQERGSIITNAGESLEYSLWRLSPNRITNHDDGSLRKRKQHSSSHPVFPAKMHSRYNTTVMGKAKRKHAPTSPRKKVKLVTIVFGSAYLCFRT